MAPIVRPNIIEQVDDPVSALASLGLEVLMDYDGWMGACNRVVFRSMGLHPQTMVGGDVQDKTDFYHQWMADKDYSLIDIVENPELKGEIPDYLTEDDPRFQMYYELLAQFHSQVFAQMIASQKFRWSPSFGKTVQQTMGETNG